MGAPASGYQVMAIPEADGVDLGDGLDWVPIRRLLGVGAFGINAYRAAAVGDVVVEDHTESTGQEEVYVVLTGAARLTIGDDEVDLTAGKVVHVVDPDLRRHGVALSAGTSVLAVGGWRDRAYHSLPWEPIYLARPAMKRGDWSEVAETLRREAGEHLETGILRYRLAHCHAKLGEDDLAIAELERSIAINPVYADRAASDEAFAALRNRDDWPSA